MQLKMELTPFRFYTEENPYPPPSNFEEVEYEDSTLPVGHFHSRHELAQPCETEKQVNGNGSVVIPFRREVEVPAQSVRVFRVAAGGGEKTQVPIHGHVPVEGVGGIDKASDQPGLLLAHEPRVFIGSKENMQ